MVQENFTQKIFVEPYESLMCNKAWKLVELPAGCTNIRYKQIFRIKYRSDGEIELLVQLFVSIRTLLAFAIQNDTIIMKIMTK